MIPNKSVRNMYELINSPTTNSEYSLETKFTDADTIPSIPIESVWLVAVGSYIIISPPPDIIERPDVSRA